MENAKKTAPNRKVQPRLSPVMHRYLSDLVRVGFLGDSPTAVAQRLIEDGIRNAIRDRVIPVRKSTRP